MNLPVGKKFCRVLVFSLTFLVFPFLVQAEAVVINLRSGSEQPEVKVLQKFLNFDPATRVSSTGVGSLGQETNYFDEKTKIALARFQKKYGITGEDGRVGPRTLKLLNYLGPKMAKMRKSLSSVTPTDWPEPLAQTGSKTKNSSAVTSSQLRLVTVKVSSVSPLSIRGNGTITLVGDGFAKTGNTVKTKYKEISNIASPDGKILSFLFSLPSDSLSQSGLSGAPTEALSSSIIVPIVFQVININGVSNEMSFSYQLR